MPPAVKLSELQPGHSAIFFAQLAVRAKSSTSTGKPYFACKFRDNARTVPAVPIWSDAPLFEPAAKWLPGQFFKLRATFTVHEKYGPQLDVHEIRPVEQRDREDGFTELDFVERSRREPAEMWDELQALVIAEIHDDPARVLVLKLLDANKESLLWLPATATKFFPFAGGWLEHTLNVAKNSAWLADQYRERYPEMIPPLNRDLVIAGALLHDIGRVKEYEGSAPGSVPRPGIDGELFGHVVLGRDMVPRRPATCRTCTPNSQRCCNTSSTRISRGRSGARHGCRASRRCSSSTMRTTWTRSSRCTPAASARTSPTARSRTVTRS